jgi:HlyD family secretion protein
VKADELRVDTVRLAPFHDFVPARGEVTPLQTVYVDSVEGGQVARIVAADGARVDAGALLAVLSNPQLEREVAAREAEVSGRIGDTRGQLLQLQRGRTDRERELEEARYEALKADQKLAIRRNLHDKGIVSDVELKTVVDEAAYRRERVKTLEAAVAQEAGSIAGQAAEIRRTLAQLQDALAAVRRSLDALSVRAPVAGRLTAFELQPGQTIKAGDRVGEVDSEGAWKLVAPIDEFYGGRVSPGLPAVARLEGRTYRLRVSRIFPQVRDGRFQTELEFVGAQPAAVRRGQSLDLELTLGDTRPALVIPNGPYVQTTGGSWIFVLDGRDRAERRAIRTGRRNPQQIEVLGGLRPGERVVTSAYDGFADKTRLVLR